MCIRDRDVTVTRAAPCETCGGSGAAPGSTPQVCGSCNGKGQVVYSQGFFMVSTTCPDCRGEGKRINDPSKDCKAQGDQDREDVLTDTVPPGVEDGQTLRLSGKGEMSREGGIPGNLYVNLHVEADERLHREGPDLFVDIHISFPLAALGGKVTIPVLKGEKEVDLEPGVQPGDVMVLRGAGVPRLDGRGKGDQIVRFQVDVPKKLPGRAADLLRDLAEELGEEVPERKGLFSRFQRSRRK